MKPGQSYTYVLHAGEDSAGVWPYHDHSPSMMDSIGGGMAGMLSILGRNEQAPDREFEVFLLPLGKFITIDGRAFVGNTPVFHAKVGQLVQWDVMALGSDFHTFHVHGHRWQTPGHVSRDTQTVGPAESFQHPLARGCSRHVAVPLPRRGPHDEGDDRDLQGVAVRLRRIALVAAAALFVLVPSSTGAGPPQEVSIEFSDYRPSQLDVLPGETVLWTNVSTRTHTVTSDTGLFDSSDLPGGSHFTFQFNEVGDVPLPLHRSIRASRARSTSAGSSSAPSPRRS